MSIGPKEFNLIEALITEKSREIARTEISRCLRRIGIRLDAAYSGGRFDNQPEADSVISYIAALMIEEADRT